MNKDEAVAYLSQHFKLYLADEFAKAEIRARERMRPHYDEIAKSCVLAGLDKAAADVAMNLLDEQA